ncbi:hypothetical protein [Bradyrhizobium roseum]|uniref:hypothetical protein n=1 Tax=Bradyrhizobium roseum TaxID=3056648 RepID=UPI002633E9D4|nr:hypothetical protein [Bradyrhizobium roseus]WKA26544.1 hypothetical protein QUH67_23505 [Bradyrhizobium roseus]
MSIASPDWAPLSKWHWLGRIFTARCLLALALFLGLSLTAVATLTMECRVKPSCLLSANGRCIATAGGPGHLLIVEQPKVCRTKVAWVLDRF